VDADAFRKILTVESGSGGTSNDPQKPSVEGALRGDSGGPAYQHTANGLEVVGVLSTGSLAITGSFSGRNVYTHVSHYAPWIIDSIARLKSGSHMSQPVKGLHYVVEKNGTSHFSITVSNSTDANHICHVSISASVLYPQMERSEKLSLTKNIADTESSTTLMFTVPGKNSPKSYLTFFAQRKTVDRPYKDFLIRAQCDNAPPTPIEKATLSNEIERELREAGY
jgi:hypothetical protein